MDGKEVLHVFSASTLILMVNPGHQTALHARKRLIQSSQLDVSTEMRFVELLLRGSPECAKQSIIWDHRRWCFQQLHGLLSPVAGPTRLAKHASTASPHFSSVQPPSESHTSQRASVMEAQLLPKIIPEDIRHEWDHILYTCETYPRNYHAWNHWRWITDVVQSSIHLHSGREDFLECGLFVSLLLESKGTTASSSHRAERS